MRNILILVLFIFIGCKKETPSVDCSSANNFVIGVESDSITSVNFDTVVIIKAPSHSNVEYFVDINNDGYPDFRFFSEHNESIGGTNTKQSSIKVLNTSIYISTIEMTDTVHQCVSTVNDSVLLVVDYNNYSNYTCIDGTIDSIIGIYTNTHPKVYETGDTIDNNESWLNLYDSEILLSYYDKYYAHWQDTFWNESHISRGNWNNTNMKYILFKRNDGIEDYYGWLKLDVTDNKEIHFYGYGYQNGFF